MTDLIKISALKLEMSIGVYEWEKHLKQTVYVDVSMYCSTRAAGISDSLQDSLDYSAVATQIVQLSRERHFQLVEAFAESIANRLLQQKGLDRLVITVTKPGAIKAAQDVSVTIERSV